MISLIKAVITQALLFYSAILPIDISSVLQPEIECCLWEVGDYESNHEVFASEYMRHFRFVAWSRKLSLVRLKLMALRDSVSPDKDNFNTYVARSKNHAIFVSRIAARAGVCIDEGVLDQEVRRICADGTYRQYGLSINEVKEEMRAMFMEYALLTYLDAHVRQYAAEYIADQIRQVRDRYANQVFGVSEFYVPVDCMYSKASARQVMDKLVRAVQLGSIELIDDIVTAHCDVHGSEVVFCAREEMSERLQRLLNQAERAGRLAPDLVIVDSDASGYRMYIIQAIIPAGQNPGIKEELVVRKLASERLYGLLSRYTATCHLHYHRAARKLFHISLKDVRGEARG